MKFVLAILLFTIVYVQANLSPEDLEKFQKMLEECKSKIEVSDQDISLLMKHELPESENGKCFAACVNKQLGIMNDDNTVNIDRVKELTSKHIKETDKQETIIKIAETCSAEVPGGSDECDVSAKLMECCIRESKAANLEIHLMELISS